MLLQDSEDRRKRRRHRAIRATEFRPQNDERPDEIAEPLELIRLLPEGSGLQDD
jgi:hypothetical protein